MKHGNHEQVSAENLAEGGGTENEIFREMKEDEIPYSDKATDTEREILNSEPLSFQTVHDYMVSKPVEVALIATASALATWILIGTAPGRKIATVALARYAPDLSSWARRVLDS